MIKYDKFTLKNGLKVIVHQDSTTPIVAFNLLYDVGARDEDENRTGFAHLFEHLMFGGSINIPNFDGPLQEVGGENNAFTSNDITNYYITLPKQNLETAFWLESDRMMSLAFTDKSLEVQRNVVIEEFKQRYLNQPYGDVWLLLRPLAYQRHPYKWATIGKEISHIAEANMDEVKAFFFKHYRPNNAVLSVAGDVTKEQIEDLAIKWFGDIPAAGKLSRNLPKEPKQLQARSLTVERNVPSDAIYKAYHICDRKSHNYYAIDLTSDILSRGDSSRLYQTLIKEKELCSNVNAYISGDFDEGLFIISAIANEGVSLAEVEKAIEDEIDVLIQKGITEQELQKVKNKVKSAQAFGNTSVLNKAMALAIAELIEDAELVNQEMDLYNKVTINQLQNYCKEVLVKSNCSTLYYQSKKEII